MKIKTLTSLLLFILMMASCLEDESAKDVILPNPIQIDDFSTPEMIYVNQGGRLKVNVLAYKEGMDDADLSFLWMLRGMGQFDTLSTSMMLDTLINAPMNREAYSLVYTVTDNKTGLKASKRWFLYVTGQYEAGLLVADTKNEQTSDLHLIVGMNFNRNYKTHDQDHIYNNVYSINNGSEVQGLITGLKTLVSYDFLRANITTNHSIMDLDPLDNFKVSRRDNDMFIKNFNGEMKVGMMQDCELYPADVVCVNGKIHKRYQYTGAETFGVGMLLGDLTDDYYVSQYCYRLYRPYPDEGDIFGIAFDQKNQRFLAFPFFREEDNFRIFRHISADGKVDPNKVGNKECVYIGNGANVRMHAVLKDQKNGSYEIWSFNMNSDDGDLRPNVIPEHYYLDRCTDIQKAHTFQSQSLEEVMYYATEDHLYAVILSDEHPQATPCYEVNPGEKITGMRLTEYCEGRMVVPNSTSLLSSRNHMMLVYTYNETSHEGKVIVVPILSLGSGDLVQDKSYHQEYGPFGRILETTCYHTR